MVLSSTTQSIIQDFVYTKLSSYQIAFKYGLPQKSTESIQYRNNSYQASLTQPSFQDHARRAGQATESHQEADEETGTGWYLPG